MVIYLSISSGTFNKQEKAITVQAMVGGTFLTYFLLFLSRKMESLHFYTLFIFTFVLFLIFWDVINLAQHPTLEKKVVRRRMVTILHLLGICLIIWCCIWPFAVRACPSKHAMLFSLSCLTWTHLLPFHSHLDCTQMRGGTVVVSGDLRREENETVKDRIETEQWRTSQMMFVFSFPLHHHHFPSFLSFMPLWRGLAFHSFHTFSAFFFALAPEKLPTPIFTSPSSSPLSCIPISELFFFRSKSEKGTGTYPLLWLVGLFLTFTHQKDTPLIILYLSISSLPSTLNTCLPSFSSYLWTSLLSLPCLLYLVCMYACPFPSPSPPSPCTLYAFFLPSALPCMCMYTMYYL